MECQRCKRQEKEKRYTVEKLADSIDAILESSIDSASASVIDAKTLAVCIIKWFADFTLTNGWKKTAAPERILSDTKELILLFEEIIKENREKQQ